MLALKKKRESEAKQAVEEQDSSKMEVDGQPKVSLLGVGGKKATKNGDSMKTSKKRSPGEIRIQKGTKIYSKSRKHYSSTID